MQILRRHGEQPAAPGWARAVVPISHAAASRAYRLRQPPPLRIPGRTPAQRRQKAFTPLELQAIAQALAAGRVQRIRRGVRGLGWRHWTEQANDAPGTAVRAQVLERLCVLRATMARAA